MPIRRQSRRNAGNLGRLKRLSFRTNGAPEFVIDRDAIVKTQAPRRPLRTNCPPGLFAGPHGWCPTPRPAQVFWGQSIHRRARRNSRTPKTRSPDGANGSARHAPPVGRNPGNRSRLRDFPGLRHRARIRATGWLHPGYGTVSMPVTPADKRLCWDPAAASECRSS